MRGASAISGSDARSLVRSIEQGVTAGSLPPGAALPSVRSLARDLGLSPTTVAAAYRDLRQRGVLVSHDRSRTVVAHRPPLGARAAPDLPAGTTDLASGNPDPELLPSLAAALAAVDPTHRLYGEQVMDGDLIAMARDDLLRDGVPADRLAVVGGALDGIERVLGAHRRVGDAVAVEDPGYPGTLDLVRTLGLEPVPVAVDDQGMDPQGLATALASGAGTVLMVPRAQNPTGAALTAVRAGQLRAILARRPDVLVIEDDHAGWISGAAHHPTIGDRPHWAVVRSLAKALGPDLRVAVLAGDDDTVTRVLGRQQLGTGWVSHLLQKLAVELWRRSARDGVLTAAAACYRDRRGALLDALDQHGIAAHGSSGLNVWVPVPEEVPAVQGLAARGWAVQAGEPYRITAAPGLRITVAHLPEDRAPHVAASLAEVLAGTSGTRRG